MSNDGKHHFHLMEYSILQLLYAGTSPAYKSCRIEYSFRWKWNYSPVFLMGWEIKRRKNLCKLSQLDAFPFFKCKFLKFLMNAKAMCLRIKVAQLNTLSVAKEMTCIPSRPTGYRFLLMRWKMKTQSYVN